jgi:anaerobic selenocysteine-containing dehydrogenase
MAVKTTPRLCPFCESSCGLLVRANPETREIISIKGDPNHPASRGFLCAKSQALRGLRDDPDRITQPLLRRGDRFVEISWDEALERAASGLNKIRQRDGIEGLGIYLGNPSAHHAGITFGMAALLGVMPALMVSASSIDSFPRFLVSLLMYGNQARVPVPDISHTDYFLIFGANPIVSNGSMMGAPDMPRRLKALRERGGQLVVVDPRKTETAMQADQYIAVRPGSDALLLLAMIHTLFDQQLLNLQRLETLVDDVEPLRALAADYAPDKVAELTGISSGSIVQLTRDFAGSSNAVAYGRVGICCQRFGSVASWLIDCLNILTGNLDSRGGALFPQPAVPSYATNLAFEDGHVPYGKMRSRVSGTPAIGNAFPTQVLWEEIDTAGEGQIKGLLTVAGNPVLSNANAGRVDAALEQLEFVVAVDIYLNETTRHADIILPPADHLNHSEMTTVYNDWMVENALAYSAPVFEVTDTSRTDWDILTELGAKLAGIDRKNLVRQYFEGFIDYLAPLLPRRPASLSIAEMLELSAKHDSEVEQIYDVLLRCGDYGDGYGHFSDGISLDSLKDKPSGINLGGMKAGRLPEALETANKKIHLTPSILVDDLHQLREAVEQGRFADKQFTLINRRHIRSNNSWLHNLPMLTKGPERHHAWLHPDDAQALGVASGDSVRISSRVGVIELPIQLNDGVGRYVISVPHGWGQQHGDVKQAVAKSLNTANVNYLSDEADADKPSGNANFNGMAVNVTAVNAHRQETQ